jgi:hypothetical protein
MQAAREAMDDMSRKQANIEDAKRRFGIKHLQVPEGPYQVRIVAAAGDNNYQRSKNSLDEIFREIVTTFPEFVLEWEPKTPNPDDVNHDERVTTSPENNVIPSETPPMIEPPTEEPHEPTPPNVNDGTTPSISSEEPAKDTKIILDKKQLPEVSWTKEEMDMIKKSRSIELNIVEDVNLKYTNIEDLDDNAVDVVLSQYQRKVNDVVSALPASKYRATFTGLTYTEILDLSHAQEMNDLDGERKKWAIAFDHIKNQSIGPWQEYKYYIDPGTKKKVILNIDAPEPIVVKDYPGQEIKVIKVSKFDDFLSKTSFIDLEFILWKILCATAMDKEIISIDCHSKFNGKECGKSYDWIYSPNELLLTSNINPAVVLEMKKTVEVQGIDDIKSNYKEAMINTNNTIELPSSKFGVVFGHVTAYDYLNYVYSEIRSIENERRPMVSQAITHSTLTVLKSFLMPKPDGGFIRAKGAKNIIKIINTLNEVDFQTISELMRIMIEPYTFKFSLRDICCPQCKNKSSIEIEDMTKLLFIVAQSLSSVQVVLKRT